MNVSYLMLIPDWLVIRMMDFVRQNDDVLIFRGEKFQEVYHDILDESLFKEKKIFDECSVADSSLDAFGRLGQG